MESPLFRVSAALGIHLIVYCAIGARLAFGLYALLQPSRTPNSGLALYKLPLQHRLAAADAKLVEDAFEHCIGARTVRNRRSRRRCCPNYSC